MDKVAAGSLDEVFVSRNPYVTSFNYGEQIDTGLPTDVLSFDVQPPVLDVNLEDGQAGFVFQFWDSVP